MKRTFNYTVEAEVAMMLADMVAEAVVKAEEAYMASLPTVVAKCLSIGDFDDLSDSELSAIYRELSPLMDCYCYDNSKEGKEIYRLVNRFYWLVIGIQDDRFYNAHIADLRAFKARILADVASGKPIYHSDLDSYSDYSKEVTGRRDRSLCYLYEIAIDDYNRLE